MAQPLFPLSASTEKNRIVPYMSRVTLFRDHFDIVPFLRTRRVRETIVDTETVSLLRSAIDDEAAYQKARDLMRLGRDRGDHETATLYTRVAIRISEITGRAIVWAIPEVRQLAMTLS